jgi:glycosyltransferase involved in cell wall biosynthesis
MAHNVESVIWQRMAEAETNPLKRWYVRQQWRKFERFEQWAYSTAPLTVAVSPADAFRIRTEYAGRRVEVIDNGVDTEFFRPDDTPRDPKRVLFLGSLDWRPNLDGVRWLLDAVWPKVVAREPTARLALVGRRPPQWLRQRVAATASVELHADVPDVRPHLAAAGVLAVPLRVGGGSRLKILEALAAGTPVVSTTVGAEGLDLQGDRHLRLADDAEALTGALLAGMADPSADARLAEAGRRRVLDRYDWGGLADRLDAVWQDLAGVAQSRWQPRPVAVA